MKVEELLKKLNKLDGIYNVINAEIEVYCISINDNIFETWQKRKTKIQLKLINQFKEEVKLRTLKKTKFICMIISDLDAKTYGYNGLCEKIGNLKNKS